MPPCASQTSAVPDTSQGLPISDPEGGDVWLGNVAFVAPTKGSYAFFSILHEIGHTVGLKHGQEDDGVHGVLPPAHDVGRMVDYDLLLFHRR